MPHAPARLGFRSVQCHGMLQTDKPAGPGTLCWACRADLSCCLALAECHERRSAGPSALCWECRPGLSCCLALAECQERRLADTLCWACRPDLSCCQALADCQGRKPAGPDTLVGAYRLDLSCCNALTGLRKRWLESCQCGKTAHSLKAG